MGEILDFFGDLLKDHPIWLGVVLAALVCIHYGPSYITAISEHLSRRERDKIERKRLALETREAAETEIERRGE